MEGGRMEIRHLQHFVALAEKGSFTCAARKVNIVQSWLSNSIRELEEELGPCSLNAPLARSPLLRQVCCSCSMLVRHSLRSRVPCKQFAPGTESFAGNCALAS